jgi:hypothetical protein
MKPIIREWVSEAEDDWNSIHPFATNRDLKTITSVYTEYLPRSSSVASERYVRIA